MDRIYEALRRELATMGYSEYLSVDSAQLVERLLADFKGCIRENRDTKTALQRAEQEKSKKEAQLLAYQSENGKAVDEINRLHQQLMHMREGHIEKIREIEGTLKKAQEQAADFELLKSQYVRRICTLEKESQQKGEKILQLQTKTFGQAIIQTTDRKKVPLPPSQKMEITRLLPQKAVGFPVPVTQKSPDPEALQVLGIAHTKLHRLEREKRDLLDALEHAKVDTEVLSNRVDVRDKEIERLTVLLKGGRPADAVLLENNPSKIVEEQAVPMQEGLSVAETRIPRKKIAESRTLGRVRKVNTGHLQRGAQEALQVQKQKQQLSKARKELAQMEAVSSENENLERQIRALKSERDSLVDKLRQLTTNEKDLLLEIDRLSRCRPSSPGGQATAMSTATSHLLPLVRELEKERDKYKEETMHLHDLIKMSGTSGVSPPQTNGDSLSSEGANSVHMDALRQAVLERDEYREKYYKKCKELEEQTVPKVLPDNRYNEEAQSFLRDLQNEVITLNKKLTEVTADRDKFIRLYSEASNAQRSQPPGGSLRSEADGLQRTTDQQGIGARTQDDLEAEISSLKAQLSESEQQFAAAKMTLNSQRMLIESQENDMYSLRKRVDEAEAKYNEVTKQTALQGSVPRRGSRFDGEADTAMARDSDTGGRAQESGAVEVDKMVQSLREKDSQVQAAKVNIATMESHISGLQSELQDKEHEVYRLQQEVQTLQRDLATANTNISKIKNENDRLNSNLSVMAKEHQDMTNDLENARHQTEDLMRQIQEYVTEVARVEELLRHKDQEREQLLEQYKNLTLANTELETHTQELESRSSSAELQLQNRDVELEEYQEAVHNLRAELAQHITRSADYDDQVNALRTTVSALKGELEQKDMEISRLQHEVTNSTQAQEGLNASVRQLQEKLSWEETSKHRLAGQVQKLEDDLALARSEAAAARSNTASLESLLTVARERECLSEANFQHLASELKNLQDRQNATSSEREAQQQENAYLRGKLVEFGHEVEQLKRQVTNERFEREKTKEELRNLQQQAARGLSGQLTLHAISGSLRTTMDFCPDATRTATFNSHSRPYSAAPPDGRPTT
ncbi:centrosomal protein of 135 kDa-like isoform X2 [Ornithodoros turicata]|uniref:centrosomal protein of 135 kDa-like isoform X2 n=1 Tax=Ornithodoros turicata TaxID=34597 RepID=UPI0031397411